MIRLSIGLLTAGACLLAAPAARAEGDLFAPPAADATPTEPLRVAWEPGVWSPGQPVVGRFGLFAPPPLPDAPMPTAALGPPEFDPGPPQDAKAKKSKPKPKRLPEVEHHEPCVDPRAVTVPCATGDFSADAFFAQSDACGELNVYNGKREVPTQRPLVEWGGPFYAGGPTPVGGEEYGATNLTLRKFYVYGDYRVGFAQNDLVGTEESVLAHRLNLELDYWITSTERFHAFVGPFQEDARFMRLVDGEFFEELDLFQAETDTLFFEGDFGAILGGAEGTYAPFDLPFTVGLVPLLFQNGVWAFDAMVGGAVTLPAKNSPWLDWSNFDVTLFAGLDRVSTGAFNFDEDAGHVFGATTFVESRGGYLEVGYGYVDDQDGRGLGYHNLGVSYTRRYANLVSNSVRLIVNAGQDPVAGAQTADGALLLVENTFLTKNPYNVLPYVNFFAGFDRPQPLARAGVFGGVLFNTGILFQPDQLTSFPTLDATGADTVGAALGVDLIAPGFDQQLIVEVAALHARGDLASRTAAGDQVGVGVRWQKQLSYATLVRADAMIGLLDNSDDVSGARVEYRWKF
ncbi:MAG: hypothetical protein AAF805_00855 [Planctomycetota bacterium]